MELDLQSLFGLHVHSCSHWLRPRNSPLPPHLGSYTSALLVILYRRQPPDSHYFISTIVCTLRYYHATYVPKRIQHRRHVTIVSNENHTRADFRRINNAQSFQGKNSEGNFQYQRYAKSANSLIIDSGESIFDYRKIQIQNLRGDSNCTEPIHIKIEKPSHWYVALNLSKNGQQKSCFSSLSPSSEQVERCGKQLRIWPFFESASF